MAFGQIVSNTEGKSQRRTEHYWFLETHIFCYARSMQKDDLLAKQKKFYNDRNHIRLRESQGHFVEKNWVKNLVGRSRVRYVFVPDVLFGVIPLSQPSFFLSSRTSSRNDSQYTRAKDSVASADRP